MVFVADDLGAWLVGLLADASRKKLTALVLGSDQERALRRAATAAVQATADEMSSSGGERAEQLAMVISEVFREPMPDAPPAGPVTLMEGLQAGIARQLAVLDDAGLTGIGQSSADVLGVPGIVLAEKLTDHLMWEIVLRGSGGGPLTPLADQLNHELTRQRVAQLADEVRATSARSSSDAEVAARPLAEVTDPFVLEVHRPVQPEDAPPGLPVLPPYVPREHDQVLGQVVRAAAGGHSGIAVLVGGSSTGKTRACWEALALLRDQDPPWRLWHPIDPSGPEAALAERPGIGPRTVVWLNEAQSYLDPADAGLGEKVAAGLRALLRDPGRAPVLVLATMWPRFWDTLTARPPGGEDRHAQARELLAGHDITVPAAFTPAQMDQLARAADVRMVLAAKSAHGGAVIQFLAGAPELLARYRNADATAKALIHAAMDARRLGMGAGLPQAFLKDAAPGYLTADQWDALDDDWLEQALRYTAKDAKGVRGPLTRIRPRPGHAARNRGDQPASMTVAAGPLYRLADYLDQHGRAHRASQIPPAEFWSAAAAYAAPNDQAALGGAAHDRGLYRDAAQLHKNAAASGNPGSVIYLARPPEYLRADPRPARWAAVHAPLDDPDMADLPAVLWETGAHEQAAALLARNPAAHVPLDDPGAVAMLLGSLRVAGAHEQAAALLARNPAAHVPLDNAFGVAELLGSLREAGAHEQAAALLARNPAAHASLDNPGTVAELLGALREAGAHEQAAALLARDPAAHASLDNPAGVAELLGALREAGAHEQAAALASRAAHVPLDNPAGVAELLRALRAVGAHEQAAALASRAAHVPLDNPGTVGRLLRALRVAGAHEQAAALASRAAHASLDDPGAAAHASLDDPGAVGRLLRALREAGAHEQAATLLARNPAAHVPLDNPDGVARLLGSLREAGAHEQAAALLARDPAAHASLDNAFGVARLLGALREAGAHEQAATLLARNPAAHVPLDNPDGVGRLLRVLREAGADEQAAALASRAATHAPLDNSIGVGELLRRLREAGAHEQAAALVRRLPAAGMFGFFLFERQDPADRFRFGREADGTPAAPWDWEDLDLCLVLVRGDMLHRRRAERDAHVGRACGTAAPLTASTPKPKR